MKKSHLRAIKDVQLRRLLEITGNAHDAQLYVWESYLVATDGNRALFERDGLEGPRALAKLQNLDTLKYDGNLTPSDAPCPDLASIMPDVRAHSAAEITVPEWFAELRVDADAVLFGLTVPTPERPRVEITLSRDDSVVFNALLWAPFAGQTVRVFFAPQKAAVIFPAGHASRETAPWFALIMPRRNTFSPILTIAPERTESEIP